MIINAYKDERWLRLHVPWRFFFQWRNVVAEAYVRYEHGKVTVGPFVLEEW